MDPDNFVCLKLHGTYACLMPLHWAGNEQAVQPNQNRALCVVLEMFVDTETNSLSFI